MSKGQMLFLSHTAYDYIHVARRYRGSLAVAVAAPWLWLQDKYSTWRQALIGSFE